MIARAIRQTFLGTVLFLATGCTTFEIHDARGMEGFKAADDFEVVTYHGSYWGFYWSETDHIPCCEDCSGLHTVVSHSNLGYALAPIFTLGLWAPTKVEYRCWVEVPDDPDDGGLPPEGGVGRDGGQ